MQIRSTSLPPILRTSAPRWLVLVAIVCWAVLSSSVPAQPQPLAESALPGFDSRSSIVASDRSPSLQTNDRRRAASAGEGNPTPAAPGSIVAAEAVPGAIQPITFSLDRPAARQPHSPAQPRAPPTEATRSR